MPMLAGKDIVRVKKCLVGARPVIYRTWMVQMHSSGKQTWEWNMLQMIFPFLPLQGPGDSPASYMFDYRRVCTEIGLEYDIHAACCCMPSHIHATLNI